jgi:hypothetical protein
MGELLGYLHPVIIFILHSKPKMQVPGLKFKRLSGDPHLTITQSRISQKFWFVTALAGGKTAINRPTTQNHPLARK